MIYLGIDYHKNYSYCTALNDSGQEKIDFKVSNTRECYQKMISKLGTPCHAVVETTYNWTVPYSMLEELGVKVKLANSAKLRVIAESQIKTDAKDSYILAELLRSNLIPEVFVPPKKVLQVKNILRHRLFLVRLKTQIKNRIHILLMRNHIKNPGLSDLFGKKGRRFLDNIKIKEPDSTLLAKHLNALDYISQEIYSTEALLGKYLKNNEYSKLLQTIPGFGKTLSALVALEICDIKRFRNPSKLSAYAGLVPSTHASGGHIFHGHLLRGANKYLRWAFIEAAWKSQVASPYCRALYYRIRKKRGPNVAIVALARRLSEIVYKILRDKRAYEERTHLTQYYSMNS